MFVGDGDGIRVGLGVAAGISEYAEESLPFDGDVSIKLGLLREVRCQDLPVSLLE